MSSSSFTISSPRFAVVRQCTLRSDSPCWYSRTLCRSKPAVRRSTTCPPACVTPQLREDALELDEPRIDEERRLRAEVLSRRARARTGPRRPLEPHRIDSGRAERSGGRSGRGARARACSSSHPAFAEPGDLLVDLERPRAGVALRRGLEPDRRRRRPRRTPARPGAAQRDRLARGSRPRSARRATASASPVATGYSDREPKPQATR